MQTHSASAAMLAAYLCAGSINADVDLSNAPMIGAQAHYAFGIEQQFRITLGSTVPTPGLPQLWHPENEDEEAAAGLTKGLYLPLTGVSWTRIAGFAPLLLGVPLEPGNPVFHALGGEGSGGVSLGWILGGVALAAGAAASGGGGGGGDSGSPRDKSSSETRIENPVPSLNDCQGYDTTAFVGDWTVSQCTP